MFHVKHLSVSSPIPFHCSVVVSVFLFAGAVLVPRGAFAETVAEWKFDSATEESGGSIVKLDKFREGASDESVLCENSTIVSAATGLGDKWNASLSTGYLETGSGGGFESSANKEGLVTKANSTEKRNGAYTSYFGFNGLGSGTWGDGSQKGGTVYLVLSPRASWRQGMRYGLMGSGHAGDGGVQLTITKSGELALIVGGRAIGEGTAKVTRDWAPDAWYFVAASWQANAEPILYVREMAPSGPAESPAPSLGSPGSPAPASGSFEGEPLVIGANWYDPGANPGTVYGAAAKIAYVRFDNIFSTSEEMEAVFKSLAAP